MIEGARPTSEISRRTAPGVASCTVAAVMCGFTGWGHPVWYALPLLAAVVAATETAVAHLSFGRHRWTFSLTEAAIAVA